MTTPNPQTLNKKKYNPDALRYLFASILDSSKVTSVLLEDYIIAQNKSSIINYNSIPSLFEGLARMILFSSLDIDSKIESFSKIISMFDPTANQNSGLIKRSSSVFIIWYLLRLSMIPIPLTEAHQMVRMSLDGYTPEIITAYIHRLDETSRPFYDVTSLFILWSSTQLKISGNYNIDLGSDGTLENLKLALEYWEREKILPKFILGGSNLLRVTFKCGNKVKKSEVYFDGFFRKKVFNQDTDFRCKTKSIIAFEDTEQEISRSKFKSLLNSIGMLENVMQKSVEISSEIWKTFIQYETDNVSLDGYKIPREVTLKFKLESGPTHLITLCEMGLLRGETLTKDNLTSRTMEDILIGKCFKIFHPTGYLKIPHFKCIRPFITINQLISQCLIKIKSEIISGFVQSKNHEVFYREECLFLLGDIMESIQVMINGEELPKESDLVNVIRSIEGAVKDELTIEVIVQRTSTIKAFPCLSFDRNSIDNFELTPCQKMRAKEDNEYEVVFEGDEGR